MIERPRQQRQTAAQAFMESLGQLEAVLGCEEETKAGWDRSSPADASVTKPAPPPRISQQGHPAPPTVQPSPPPDVSPSPLPSDWETALEDAAADIEQFMNDDSAVP